MSLLQSVLQTALKSRTDFDLLTTSVMVFIPEGEKFSIRIDGMKEGKPGTFISDELKADADANKLRMFFMQSVSGVKGKVDRVQIDIDFLNKTTFQTIFYRDGKSKLQKKFKL